MKKAQSEPATTEGDDEKAGKTRRIKALMIETGIKVENMRLWTRMAAS